MELKTKKFIKLLLVAAILPITQVRAEYYNSALAPAYRSTQTTMQQAIADNKTSGSIVTSIKNQGDTGTCWAFSTIAAAETSLMKQMETAKITNPSLTIQNFDFSEKYAGWMIFALSKAESAKTQTAHAFFIPKMTDDKTKLAAYPTTEPDRTAFSNLSQGGNIDKDFSVLMGNFLVDETGKPELQFYGKTAQAALNITDSIVTPAYKARDIYTKWGIGNKMGLAPTDPVTNLQDYKALLKRTGSLRVDYNYNEGETTATNGGIYNSESKEADHAILVVGFDDNYSFVGSNLKKKPPGPGAWIVKNSWGSDAADAGFYYLSYYDKSASFSSATVIEPDIARYTVTDTHTPLITGDSIKASNPSNDLSFVSKYTPKASQFIKAVSFLTGTDGASYTIEIIKNTDNPGSKPVYTQSGTFALDKKMSGYHTVDLDKFILVPEKDSYSIRVTVRANSGAESVYLTIADNAAISNLNLNNNETFYKEGSAQWADTNKSNNGAVVLNGQAKETASANGGDFTGGSLSSNKNSNIIINLGKVNEAYTTDILAPNRKTLSNMTADINGDDDFWGTITGEGGVTKTGTGELSYRGNNTYTGITNVNQGILNNFKSTESNVDVKNGAKYIIINSINETVNQRGINNEGTVLMAADKKGIIKFANTSDALKGSAAGKWYLNTLDETLKKKATIGTIIVDANTNDVMGDVYLDGGTIKITPAQTNLFVNAFKHNGADVKINFKTQPTGTSAVVPNPNLTDVNLGKMTIEGTTELDMDVAINPSALTSDLIKGTVVKADGVTPENTSNKIKLGFTIDQDVTFTDIANGVFSKVAEGQIGKVINGSAFVIDRNTATGSYNISYSYDIINDGVLKILNAAGPISLQDAITSVVTSKYYSMTTNESLSAGWLNNINGNDLTILGNNAQIDGNNSTSIFNVSSDKMLNLKDLTIVKGNVAALSNEGYLSVSATSYETKLAQNQGVNGGAIYNNRELILLTSGKDIKIQDNNSTNGAGICNDAGTLTSPSTTSALAKTGDIVFDNNQATTDGGAIYNKADVLLWADGGKIQLNNNKAQSGAGIYNNGSLTVFASGDNIDFSKNKATTSGGAIINNGGGIELLAQGGNINFSQNEALNGGAIYNTKPIGATEPALINIIADTGNITFDGNTATNNGGGIYNTETINILALTNQKVSFNQSTDKIYNTGNINFNYNSVYGLTNGRITTGAELGGAGTYNLYSGELAFVKATNNTAAIGSIANTATLSVMNDATLNLANGVKETFNPGTLTITDKSALFVAIDCFLNGNASEADVLNAGNYSGGATSQIIIAAVNLINPNNESKTYYRIKISESLLKSIIARNVLAEIAGYRSAYSAQTGDLLMLSKSVTGLVDYVASSDSVRTYSLTEDDLVIFPLGTMGGEKSTLNIAGNNKKIVSGFSDIDGITVSETNTLNASSVTFDNFQTAITNKGNLNLSNATFNGQVGPTFFDVRNYNSMTATNNVAGKILNSGLFTAGSVNNLSNLSIKSTDGSILDLRNTTNDVSLQSLAIAGTVNLYINGTNKLDATAASRDVATDTLLIKAVSEINTANTIVTQTATLRPFIKIANDAVFGLTAAVKPVGAYNAYMLEYSDATGAITVAGVNLSNATTKTGSLNVENSTNFVASATNTVAAANTVTLNGPKDNLEINITNDTTVTGTFGVNNLGLTGKKIVVDDTDYSELKLADSTVGNELVLNGGDTEVKNSILNGKIKLEAPAILSFVSGESTVNSAIVGKAGSTIIVDAATTFNGTVDPVSEIVNSDATHNANVSQVDFTLNDNGVLTFTNDDYLTNDSTNSIYFNNGTLNLMNGAANTIMLKALAFASATDSPVISSLLVDVDLANKSMDRLEATTVDVGNGSILNVARINLISDANEEHTTINFTNDSDLKAIVTTSATSVAYSPIYQYLVAYDKVNGNFDFTRSLNPAILASSVAAQVGSYLTQINTYEQALGNMDMLMSMTNEQRQAMKFANKYAATGSKSNLATFSPNQIPEQDKGIWFRPYTTFENVGLSNGPTVGNVAYGSLVGGDTPTIELKNGWDAVFTGYAGYNGSHQTYDRNGIYQNGATLGATGVFYKENFFTGLTANVGANMAEANTMYGNEEFTMLAAGIASKTGYNWELADGKFIVQPNYLMSYSFVNTFNYTNAAGVDISSDPLNAIQISPGLKFIGNLKNGWQPYSVVQMVWNIMDQTKFSANDVSLPSLSIKPYIQYGIGLQRRWGERFTGYGQALIRNGGRNGIALQFGFRFALGKGPTQKHK